MGFRIESYHQNYLEGMAARYNAETAREAHIAPLTPQRFLDLVENKSYFDPAGLLVAVAGGKVVGWIHACVAAGSEPHHDPGKPTPQIRMLVYPADQLKVGAALVSEATAWLKQSACGGHRNARPTGVRLLAMHAQQGYPFYRGLWLGGEPMCLAALAHVQLALEVGGYRNTQESVFMVAEMPSAPAEVGPEVSVQLVDAPAEMAHEPMRESWIGFEPMLTRAMLDGREVGSIGWVILPHVADRLGALAVSIWCLGVAEQHRRKGIASALIGRAMARSYRLGARFASVGTQLWNAPAHATYAKLGFAPHCVLVGRTLEL